MYSANNNSNTKLTPYQEKMIQEFNNDNYAYIKNVVTEGKQKYIIYSASGVELASFTSKHEALVTAVRHDLEPVSLH